MALPPPIEVIDQHGPAVGQLIHGFLMKPFDGNSR
ncbi:hypothetical protein OKW43_007886 [Paraburkholderia sp. WC7.3g]